ncbi:response regulator [Flavobacterium enshiense]|uniref:response regulator n=1 Tax=Flavobacterium enshiense TaxID=1341165 RepID=UPI00345D6D36
MSQLKTLALIDDDEIIVYLTQRIVSETKLVDLIQVFRNGKEAIDYIVENKNNPQLLPEIIFLDLSMPIMDGWEFLENYIGLKNEIEKSIIIYVITSSTSSEDMKRVKNIKEVSDYLVKPVTKAQFISVINQLHLS